VSQDIDAAGAHEVRTFMLNSHWPEFPYPGLRPFSVTNSADESLIFYGRNAHKDDILRRLNIGHTVFVLGPSGCGKSSLIKAGVIPALEAGLLTRAGHRWRSAEMRPGNRPLAALAKAITSLLPETNEQLVAEVERLLRSEPSGLWLAFDFVRSSIGIDAEDRCVLLLLDQLEEVFGRQIVDGKEVDQLMRLITRFFLKPHPKLFLTLTMRSEFVGDCANFPRLAEVINASQYLTPVLTPGELRQAIERPATEYGGVVDSDLVQQIIADMGSGTSYESDHLPLMQHALLWLWQRAWRRAGLERPPRPDRDPSPQPIRLTREDYVSHGGFKGILDRHADDILASVTVDPEGGQRRKIAKVMFQRISLRDDQLRYRRSPATVEEICQLASCAPAELYTVTQPFTEPEGSLIEVRPSEGTGDKFVDVRHETLIRQWSTLRRWADEEFDSAQRYKQLEDAAKLWHEGRASLWTKRQLADALAWRKRQDPKPAWAARYARPGPGDPFQLAMDFIRKSELHRLRRRGLTTVAIGLPVMLIVGALWIWIHATTYVLAALPYLNPEDEFTDFRVEAQVTLKDRVGAATPNSIPAGGRIISTLGLKAALHSGLIDGSPFTLIDAWIDPTHDTIPKAVAIPYAGLPGHFEDDTQHMLEDELKQRTANNPDMPLVFFCQGPHCWESYNACLRAINLGYARVYWYRGGLAAWFAVRDNFDIKNLDLKRIGVKPSNLLANAPEILRVIGLVLKSTMLRDHNEAVPLDTLIADGHNSRGIDHSSKRDFDHAIRDYDQAIKLNPNIAQFYNNRGGAYRLKSEYDRAIGDYNEAINLDPNYAIAYIGRGNAYVGKGEYDRAIQEYDEAIKLNPKFAIAYANRARVHYLKDDNDHAIRDYDEAVALAPKNAQLHDSRGNAYFAKGDHDRAMQDFNQSVQLDAENAFSHQNRALAELYSGSASLAVNDLAMAVKLEPSNHYFVIWLHIARTRAGQNDVNELASNAERLDQAKWPWSIVGLFLGSSSPERVRAAAQVADSPDMQQDQVCEADFFLGIYQQEKGARDEARRLLESAAKTCPRRNLEYRTAKHELEGRR